MIKMSIDELMKELIPTMVKFPSYATRGEFTVHPSVAQDRSQAVKAFFQHMEIDHRTTHEAVVSRVDEFFLPLGNSSEVLIQYVEIRDEIMSIWASECFNKYTEVLTVCMEYFYSNNDESNLAHRASAKEKLQKLVKAFRFLDMMPPDAPESSA